MKLYTFDPAPNPRRVNLFIAYKGIELPTEQINLRELEQLSEPFKSLNPRCVVPALQLDDGTVLCDGIAICWYLEKQFPQKPLLGTTPLEQAQVLSWDQFIFTDGFLAVADGLRNRSEAFKNRAVPGPVQIAQIPELEARGRARLQIFWPQLEQHLEGRDYLVGNAPTFADINALVTIDFAGWIKEKLPAQNTRTHAWYERVKSIFVGQ
jgi:glutathione S-transferase